MKLRKIIAMLTATAMAAAALTGCGGSKEYPSQNIWDNPKFCVIAKSGANREKFIMGGRRVKRLPPC